MKDSADTQHPRHDLLTDTVAATRDLLNDRLVDAETCRNTRTRPRHLAAAADPFLASTSRHVAAASAVLAPAARRHLPDGRRRAQEFTRQARRLEATLAWTKAKIYGSSFAVRHPLAEVWAEVDTEFAAFCDLERHLVDDLATICPETDRDRIADRLFRTEQRVPTRPHPHLPHGGLGGRFARGVAGRIDRFWDTAEGRMVPEPVQPHGSREGRLTRYLLADSDL